METQPTKRTSQQNRRIWSLVGKLASKSGILREESEEIMRLVNDRVNGTEQTSVLTVDQADLLINEMGNLIRDARRDIDDIGYDKMVTPGQLRLIDSLYSDLRWNKKSQIGFNKRQTKKPWPQTRADANSIITALSAILLKEVRSEEISGRLDKLDAVKHRLTPWEKAFKADLKRQLTEGGALTVMKLKKFLEIEGKYQENRSAT